MNAIFSHWGLQDDADASGSYETTRQKPVRIEAALVLTEAGEVLIHRNRSGVHCCVAIVIGRSATGLSRPQSERLQRAWDMAVAVADGNKAIVQLQPMPHHWRFSRTDYLTIDEWQSMSLSASSPSAPAQPARY